MPPSHIKHSPFPNFTAPVINLRDMADNLPGLLPFDITKDIILDLRNLTIPTKPRKTISSQKKDANSKDWEES